MANTYIGNRGGIVYTTATQTTAGSATANAVYTLPDHTFRFLGPVGIMIVTMPTPGVSTVLGVTVQVNSQTITLTDGSGNAITTAPNAGDYIFSFNKVDNTLKMI